MSRKIVKSRCSDLTCSVVRGHFPVPEPLMPSLRTRSIAPIIAGLALGCGGESTGPSPNPGTLPTPSVACAGVARTQLAVGQHVIIDPVGRIGCVRLPAPGGSDAKYLMVLVSTASTRSTTGVQGPYLLRASSPGDITAAPVLDARVADSEAAAPEPGHSTPAAFDALLRSKEREVLAQTRASGVQLTAPPSISGPTAWAVGDTRQFKACGNLQCSAFSTITATLRVIGQHAEIYMDNAAPPADPLQDGDLSELGDRKSVV